MSQSHALPAHQHWHHLKKMVVHVWQLAWLRVALRTTLGGLSLAMLLMVALQLAYPRTWTLPQTYIGGEHYGYQSARQIAADINGRQKAELTVATGGKALRYKASQLGVSLDGSEDAKSALHYSWAERLTPFSFIWERREVPYYSLKIDEKRAQQFATSLKQYNQQPVDAEVRLEGRKVVVRKHKNGYDYEASKIVADIKQLQLTSDLAITLEPVTAYPKVTDDMATAAAGAAQSRLQKAIKVTAADKELVASPEQIASWIEFKTADGDRELRVAYDKDKIGQWLMPLADQVYIAGQPRTTTVSDGVETGTIEGSDGRVLDKSATIEAIAKAAGDGGAEVAGVVAPVKLDAQITRNYSRSSKGLQALLDYWDAGHTGTWGVVVRQLDGSMSASFNADRQFTSASVYKLYIAYVVYTKADSGEIKMDGDAGNGKTVDACLDVMIVRSDNACAEALGGLIGWSANDDMLHSKGFNSTSIGYGHQLTTAQDAADYLLKLQTGTLLSTGNREALMSRMRNNIYRYAIPAATPGVASANKLGTVGNFNHDVAIVYHPKGAYILSVFSQGSNHGQIRELARQIAAVMNQ